MPENYIWLKFVVCTLFLSHVTPKRHLAARGGPAAARSAPLCLCLLFTASRAVNKAGFSISRYERGLYGHIWQADAQGGITFLCLDDGVSILISPTDSADNSPLADLSFICISKSFIPRVSGHLKHVPLKYASYNEVACKTPQASYLERNLTRSV